MGLLVLSTGEYLPHGDRVASENIRESGDIGRAGVTVEA
jgi:hypothetical protein